MAAAACNWDDALIVLSVTSGVTDLLLNFLFHAHRAGVDLAHVRVIAYDNASRSVADGCLGPGRTLTPASRVVLGDYIYGQQSFFKIQVNKLPAVRRLLATERRPIVFSDIDTVWLQNPARALLSRSNASFQIAPDGSGVHARDPTKRDMGCGCFFAACNDAIGEDILKRWDAATTRGWHSPHGAAEQDTFNQKVLSARAADVRILPSRSMPSGRGNPKPRAETVWLHANWLRGNKQKKQRLQAHGFWQPRCPLPAST